MAFITTVAPEDAPARVQQVFDEIRQWRGGRLPAVLECMSLNPDAMRAVVHLNRAVTFGASSLGRRREELIATVVSAMNDCDY